MSNSIHIYIDVILVFHFHESIYGPVTVIEVGNE